MFEWISDDDVVSTEIYSDTFYGYDYFNPGYKNRLVSSIEISLNDIHTFGLFNEWISGNPDAQISLTLNWYIYDLTDDGNRVILGNDVPVITHPELFLSTDSSFESGTYYIDDYYVIYPFTSTSIYSGTSICNSFDDTYFESGHTYKFENQLNMSWTDPTTNILHETNKAFSFEMTGNSKPYGGNCTVSPNTGICYLNVFAVLLFFLFNCVSIRLQQSTEQ